MHIFGRAEAYRISKVKIMHQKMIFDKDSLISYKPQRNYVKLILSTKISWNFNILNFALVLNIQYPRSDSAPVFYVKHYIKQEFCKSFTF